MLKVNRFYLVAAFALFLIELYIGFYVRDQWIRPYGGDFLVVILLYCLVKAFWPVSVWKAALGVLTFAFLIEFLQFLHVVEWLGLERNKIASTVIGTSFAWEDMLAYALGVGVVMGLEWGRNHALTF